MARTIDDSSVSREYEEIDRWDGGVGWIGHPEERIQRASHVLADGVESWVVDPVDVPGVDDLVDEFGPVDGVVITLDRHVRDAESIAGRLDAPIVTPDWFDGLEDELESPVERFGRTLGESYRAIPLVNNRFWREVALWNEDVGTLYVPEAIGTASFFRTAEERLGVHPVLRPRPPRDVLGHLEPERVLVGHGAGILEDGASALHDALDGARRRLPRLYASQLRAALPV